MKKTLCFIAGAVGAGFYFDEDPQPKVIETVREIETIKEMTPILVKPSVIYVSNSVEVAVEKEPVLPAPPEKNWDQEMLNGVKYFEGFRSNAYYCCAGVKTIGYGETDKNIVALGAITEHEAADLLLKKLNNIRNQVKKEVKVPLNDAQLCALTSFTFNLGLSNLKQLINGKNRLNDGNYDSVAKIMPKYRMAGGKVREGLVKRRAWEVSLWNSNPQY